MPPGRSRQQAGGLLGLLSRYSKLSHEGKMIGGNQGHAAAVKKELLQSQIAIKVHMIQMHQRQHAGIGPPAVQMELNVNAYEFLLQHSRNQATRPFVEIAQHQARMLQRWG